VAYLKLLSFFKYSDNACASTGFLSSTVYNTASPPYIFTKSAKPLPNIPLSITNTLSPFSVKEAHAASSPNIPSPLNM